MPFTIPPANKVANQGGFVADIDNAYAALAAVAGVNVQNSAYAGGADPTGVADSTAAFQAAAAAVLAAGPGFVYVPPGDYLITPGQISVNASGFYFRGPGKYAARLHAAAGTSGDVIRMFDSVNPASRTVYGGGVTGLSIYGSSTAGCNGLHIGDLQAMQLDVEIEGFTGTGSTGLLLDNANWWTEEGDLRAVVKNCTNLVTFTQSGTGLNSFGYGNYDFTCFASGNQQPGVQILAGAFVYHSSLRIRGNFGGGVSATTAAALVIKGQNSTAQASALQGCRLDIQVECSSSTNPQPTIVMDTSPFCSAFGNYGILDFGHGAANFAPSGLQASQFNFTGIVNGDSGLKASTGFNGRFVQVNAPHLYNGQNNGNSGNIPTPLAEVVKLTLSANTTIVLNPSTLNGAQTIGLPQRVTIIITQAAAGGPFTVTWPHAGSPTTSAPTVLWAGGTAPTMTATANAVDMYELSTFDGATWIGRATQNVS